MTNTIATDVVVDVVTTNKKADALKAMAKLLASKRDLDAEELAARFADREAESSTGFGNSVAIPHAKISGLQTPFIGVATFSEPVEWESLDDAPVSIAIGLVMPLDDPDQTHLKVLSKLARKLMDDEFIASLHAATHDAEALQQLVESVL